MPLDVKKEFDSIREQYAGDPSSETFNALICGEKGTGKTTLLTTCRKPVLVDSFDPGGLRGLKPWIDKGEIIPDTRWEHEDPMKPSVYENWAKAVNERFSKGLFQHLGTYCLDSSTTWAQAIMNHILQKAGRPGTEPLFTKDYGPQKVKIQNHIQQLLNLPCDFILTGHLEATKDEVSGRIDYRYMTTGKGSVVIPLLFDELYVMTTQETPSGLVYKLLTRTTGRYVACSRLASIGSFETYEEPNIKRLLMKAGLPHQDRPLFS